MLLHVVFGLVGIFFEAFRLFLHAFLDLEYSGRLGLVLKGMNSGFVFGRYDPRGRRNVATCGN